MWISGGQCWVQAVGKPLLVFHACAELVHGLSNTPAIESCHQTAENLSHLMIQESAPQSVLKIHLTHFSSPLPAWSIS